MNLPTTTHRLWPALGVLSGAAAILAFIGALPTVFAFVFSH